MLFHAVFKLYILTVVGDLTPYKKIANARSKGIYHNINFQKVKPLPHAMLNYLSGSS